MIFHKAMKFRLQPRINYPAKLSIIFQATRWTFNEIRDFQTFLMKRSELNRKFDHQKQVSSEAQKGKQRGKNKKKNLLLNWGKLFTSL